MSNRRYASAQVYATASETACGSLIVASSSSASGSSTSPDTTQLLTDFLKLLQDSTGSTASYGSDGQSASTSVALLLNYQS
jgi:hypothetical protein